MHAVGAIERREECLGGRGVDLFFLISGFLMWTITDIRPQSPFNFILHRLVRIAPLYWFVTSLLLVGDLSKIEAGIRELNLGEVVILDVEGRPVSR